MSARSCERCLRNTARTGWSYCTPCIDEMYQEDFLEGHKRCRLDALRKAIHMLLTGDPVSTEAIYQELQTALELD